MRIPVFILLFIASTAQGQESNSVDGLTIAAVGDMMLGTEYPENRLPSDDGVSYLSEVSDWLSSADIAFGNLEGVLADDGEPGKKCSNPKACYRFRMPTRYARHFADAGFDVLSLANNHARDFGEEGRTSTMRALSDVGILHSGRVGTVALLERNGLNVAVINYAVTRNSNMMLDYRFAERMINELADEHDIVIVTFHGGAEGAEYSHLAFGEEEYYNEPRGDVVRFSRMAVDAGADLVLGHGPHVVRAMERYNDRLIAYSLGNFATAFGISISGPKGIAPILIATLDTEGRFVEGQIVSTIQRRPHSVKPDPRETALAELRRLSSEDFGEPGLEFMDGGRLLPAERPPVSRRTEFGPDDKPGDDGPRPCKEDWFWYVESTVKRDDEVSLGPEPGSAAWQAIVTERAGIQGAGIDEPATDAWCEQVATRLFRNGS